jgi:uncharacterized membrane protein YvbJ
MTEEKEEFCVACVSGIAALMGAGTATSTATDRKKNKKTRAIIFWVSIVLTIISILVSLYFLCIKKCSECA